MAANNLPIYPKEIKMAALEFLPGDATNIKTLVTSGVNGCRLDSIIGASNDSVAKVFNLYVNDGVNATDFRIGTVNIPANARSDANATPSKKVLNSTDIPGLDSSGSLWLAPNWQFKIGAQAAVSSDKKIHITAFYGSY